LAVAVFFLHVEDDPGSRRIRGRGSNAGDAGARPDLAPEAIGLGPVPGDLGDLRLLVQSELGWVSGSGLGAEYLGTAGPVLREGDVVIWDRLAAHQNPAVIA
jgi:hypothetical protein